MRRMRGFTLFEVILAIAIVVMLMGTLAVTLKTALDAKRSAERSIMSVRDIYSITDILVAELQNAAPPNINSNVDALSATFNQAADAAANGGQEIVGMTSAVPMYTFGPFTGAENWISFYTTGAVPKAVIQGDARYVYICLEEQEDGTQALVRHVEPNLLGQTSPEDLPTEMNGEILPEILITNVQSVTFTYFDGTSWNTAWDSLQAAPSSGLTNTLPYAVKIELVLEPLKEGDEGRPITRCATIWCAEASVTAATEAAGTTTDTGTMSTGFGF